MSTAPKKRVLLLEDDYESMCDLKEHLEETLNWHVELTAETDLLQRLSRERFDLIMVDLMIHPLSLNAQGEEAENIHFDGVNWRKTGLEFLKRLRGGAFSGGEGQGTPPDVPVLVLSAVADYSIENELKDDASIAGYVEKPFRLDKLVGQMRQLLEG